MSEEYAKETFRKCQKYCGIYDIPSIMWDGISPFNRGIARVKKLSGQRYVVVSLDPNIHNGIRVLLDPDERGERIIEYELVRVISTVDLEASRPIKIDFNLDDFEKKRDIELKKAAKDNEEWNKNFDSNFFIPEEPKKEKKVTTKIKKTKTKTKKK